MDLVKAFFLAIFSASMIVFEASEIFIQPKNISVIANHSMVLYCNTSGFTPSNVTWIKDTDILSHNNTLNINNALREHNGRYICNATNGSWYWTDDTFVTVKYPPSIKLTANHTVVIQSNTSLTCQAIEGEPSLSLFKDGKLLKRGQDKIILQFNPVNVNDTGWYTCKAVNDVGNQTKKTYLDVQYAPTVSISGNSTISSWLGKHILLECKGRGNPTPNITWYKDTSILSNNENLNVSITSTDQLGMYRCIARNIRGYTSRGVRLKRTRFPPGITKITNNETNLSSRNLMLTWSIPNDNGSPITHYDIQKQQIYNNGSKSREGTWTISQSIHKYLFNLSWGGHYRFLVTAVNKQGKTDGQAKDFIVIDEPTIKPKEETFPISAVAGGCAALLAVIIFVICLVCCIRKRPNDNNKQQSCRKQPSFNHSILMDELSSRTASSPTAELPNDRYSMGHPPLSKKHSKSRPEDETPLEQAIYDNVAFTDKSVEGWEIPREKVCIEKIIGKGAFCQVAKAFVTGLGTVAVKMIRSKGNTSSNREDLLAEYKLLQHLGTHDNVILVLGGVTTTDPVMVLFEYVPYGDLLGYLRRSRGLTDNYYTDPERKPSSSLTSKQLLRFAREVADGMDFISSKKIIHRDLAARNVLVGQGETCKITDFGMARDVKNNDDIYQKKRKGRLPVKWTAYEALLYGFYSTQSDVWSYAILLYEIFTIGGNPYPDIDHRFIAEKIYEGYRMPKPSHLDDEIYALMTECWRTALDLRPSFNSISSTLRRLERHEKDYVHMDEYEMNLYANLDEI